MQLLHRFEQHERTNEQCLKGTYQSFNRIRGVFEVDTGGTDQSVELGMVFGAEGHREPCNKIPAPGMVSFDSLLAANNTPAHR
jgi:hypothetical protein